MTNTPDIHHIKTYFVFFIVSACIVGSLVYLYIPSGSASTSTNNHLQSSIISSEVVTPFVEPSDKNDSDEITRKRIILTRLLLKYQ